MKGTISGSPVFGNPHVAFLGVEGGFNVGA